MSTETVEVENGTPSSAAAPIERKARSIICTYELGQTMTALGRSNRRNGSMEELKAGLLLDEVRLLRDLAATIEKKMAELDDPDSTRQYTKLLIEIYHKTTLAIQLIPDIPANERTVNGKNGHQYTACPSNISSGPTININRNENGKGNEASDADHVGVVDTGGTDEVVLSEGR